MIGAASPSASLAGTVFTSRCTTRPQLGVNSASFQRRMGQNSVAGRRNETEQWSGQEEAEMVWVVAWFEDLGFSERNDYQRDHPGARNRALIALNSPGRGKMT